jgi:hypothetical protein
LTAEWFVNGELSWDHEEAFNDEIDPSKDIWSGKQGKELKLEYELSCRLHVFQVTQELSLIRITSAY